MPSRYLARLIATGAIVLASIATTGLQAAHATPADSAFVEESVTAQSQTLDVQVDTAQGDTVGGTTSATNGALTLTATKSGGSPITAILKPPNGQQLSDGTYSNVSTSSNATGASLVISPTPQGIFACTGIGSVTVSDIAFSGPEVSSLTATYSLECSGQAATVWGELRLNSYTGYKLLTTTPTGSVAFGDAPLNVDTTKTLTIRSAGNEPTTIGTPTISGQAPDAFSLTDNTCTGPPLTPTSTCTVTVHFMPTAVQIYNAKLVYPANTPFGERDIFLSGSGASPPTAPNNVRAIPGDDGIAVLWGPPATTNGTITGYNVYRDTGSGYTLLKSLGNTTQYVDTSLSSGSSASYEVTAVNAGGEGTNSSAASSTVLTATGTAGSVTALTDDADAGVFTDGGNAVVDPATVTAPSVFSFDLGGTAFGVPIDLSIGTVVGNTRLTTGEYDTTSSGDATHPALGLSVDGENECSDGTVTLTAADFHADGSPDVVSGHYLLNCNAGTTVTGEIRYHASGGYAAASASPDQLTPAAPVGQAATPVTTTITNTGTVDESLGTASITGAAQADYGVGSDSCSGQTITPQNNCEITIDFTPSSGGARGAVLTISDSTVRGQRSIALAGVGQVSATAPQDFSAVGAAGRVDVSWSAPADDGGAAVTGYLVLRGDSPETLSVLASPAASATSYIDTTAAVGHTYLYAVQAVTSVSDGAESTPADATARGSEIVFAEDTHGFGDYDIYAAASDGSDPVPVVTTGADKGEPVVSPDGKLVAYSDNESGSYHIWVARMDGTGSPQQLTSGPDDDADPSWSPDGATIAFDRSAPNADTSDIYTVPAAGGNATSLNDAEDGARPSWTPSGREIVFAGGLSSADGVDIVAADGSGGRRTILGTAGGEDPAVSPDGTEVAFIAVGGTYNAGCGLTTAPKTHVDTVSINGGAPTAVTSTSAAQIDDDPSWWPDGSAISYDITTTCSSPGSIATDALTASATPAIFTLGDDVDEPSVNFAPEPPRPVEAVTATLQSNAVSLSWTPSGLPADLSPGHIVVRRSDAGGTAPASESSGTAVYTGTSTSVIAGGLTNGKTYAFSIFRVASDGTSSAAATISATPVATPKAAAASVSATASTALTFPLSWSSTGAKPAAYEVLASRNNAALSAWLASTTSTHATFGAGGKPAAVRQGDIWTIVVRARDAFGNLTAASDPVTVTVPYDDTSPLLHWSTGWKTTHGGTRWLHTEHSATGKGKSLKTKLTGSRFQILGDKGPTYGSFTVYIDGHRSATVSAHAASTQVRKVLWHSKPFARPGKHTIMVVVSGTKGHPKVAIDAVSAGP